MAVHVAPVVGRSAPPLAVFFYLRVQAHRLFFAVEQVMRGEPARLASSTMTDSVCSQRHTILEESAGLVELA